MTTHKGKKTMIRRIDCHFANKRLQFSNAVFQQFNNSTFQHLAAASLGYICLSASRHDG